MRKRQPKPLTAFDCLPPAERRRIKRMSYEQLAREVAKGLRQRGEREQARIQQQEVQR